MNDFKSFLVIMCRTTYVEGDVCLLGSRRLDLSMHGSGISNREGQLRLSICATHWVLKKCFKTTAYLSETFSTT